MTNAGVMVLKFLQKSVKTGVQVNEKDILKELVTLLSFLEKVLTLEVRFTKRTF